MSRRELMFELCELNFTVIFCVALLSAANSFVSTSLAEPVKLRMGLSADSQYDFEPITVHEMFARSLRRPGAAALPGLGIHCRASFVAQ